MLYWCDPEKNTECRKTSCFENGGEALKMEEVHDDHSC